MLESIRPTTWTEIYNQMWVKDYTAAKIKKQWGQNMTKFQNVQMPRWCYVKWRNDIQ